MTRCRSCRYGDRTTDASGTYYMCRLQPPHPEVVNGEVKWLQPAMLATAWCGQAKLAIFKWLKSFVRRGT
jgi:hypothetical protein